MEPFSEELGKVSDGESRRVKRGPLIIKSIQSDRIVEVWNGPPWAGESTLAMRLDGNTFTGEIRVSEKQSIVVPNDDDRACLVEGVVLGRLEAPQREKDNDDEAGWKFLARDLPPPGGWMS
jgi:hypothetical protein